MTIAITGATGQLGRLVVQLLKEVVAPSEIIALVRTPAKAADLGVAAREADYTRPETLGPALEGVDTLLLISSSEVGQRAPQHRNVIAAAKAQGVRRVVYTSILAANSSPLALAEEHRITEADLAESGLAVTVLRNGWYIENHTAGIAGARAAGAVYGSAGDGKFSAAARADYAAAAVAALTDEAHAGKVYELGGTAYTLSDFAAELSKQTGETIGYVDLPQAQFAAALVDAGLPEGFAGVLADSDAGAAKGALATESQDLQTLIARTSTPLAEVIGAALAAG